MGGFVLVIALLVRFNLSYVTVGDVRHEWVEILTRQPKRGVNWDFKNEAKQITQQFNLLS